MGKNILVASSKIEFNELLRLNLEESGDYSVIFATTGEETLRTAEAENFSLIILDAELNNAPIQTFYPELKKKFPWLRLIVIPPQNNPQHPSLAEVEADGFLSIPFFKPNLLELIENVLSKEESVIQPVDLPGDEPAAESLDDTFSFPTPDSEEENALQKEEKTETTNTFEDELPASLEEDLEKAEGKIPSLEFDLDLEEELESLMASEMSTASAPEIQAEPLVEELIETASAANAVGEDKTANETDSDSQLPEPEFEEEVEAQETSAESKTPPASESQREHGSKDLLASVLEQIKAQSVPEQESGSDQAEESVLEEGIEMENKTESESPNTEDDLLKNVMSQIQSQGLSDEEAAALQVEVNPAEPTETPPPEVEPDQAAIPSEEESDADLLKNVMSQIQSQAVPSEEAAMQDELDQAMAEIEAADAQAKRGVSSSEDKSSDEEWAAETDEDLLANVMAQINSQAVSDEEAAALQIEPEETAEEKPDETTDKDVSPQEEQESDLFGDVMAQIKSQAVADEEAANLQAELDTAAEKELPDLEALTNADDDLETEELLQNVLAQLESQSVPDEVSQLESELNDTLSKPPEKVEIKDIPKVVKPVSSAVIQDTEDQEIPPEILEELNQQFDKINARHDQKEKPESQTEKLDEGELAAALEDTRPISIDDEVPMIPPIEESDTEQKKSAEEIAETFFQEEEPLTQEKLLEELENIESFSDGISEEPLEELAPGIGENPDHILQNVLGQLKVQATEDETSEVLTEEEQKIFDEFVSEIENDTETEDQPAETTEESLLEESLAEIVTETVSEAELDEPKEESELVEMQDAFEVEQPEIEEPIDKEIAVEIPIITEKEIKNSLEAQDFTIENIQSHLEEVVENSLASTAFVSQDARIFASTGDMTPQDLKFFEEILSQNLSDQSGINLARFVELGKEKSKHLLYVTTIQEALSLGIAQADSTHVSKLRSFTIKKAGEIVKNKLFKGYSEDLLPEEETQTEDEIEESLEESVVENIEAEEAADDTQLIEESVSEETDLKEQLEIDEEETAESKETVEAIIEEISAESIEIAGDTKLIEEPVSEEVDLQELLEADKSEAIEVEETVEAIIEEINAESIEIADDTKLIEEPVSEEVDLQELLETDKDEAAEVEETVEAIIEEISAENVETTDDADLLEESLSIEADLINNTGKEIEEDLGVTFPDIKPVENVIEHRTIEELLEEIPEDNLETEEEDSQKWMPEIDQTEKEFEEKTVEQPKEKKKVYLKSGYGAYSNKLKYQEGGKLPGKPGKLNNLQINEAKVPSIQLEEDEEISEKPFESPVEPDEEVTQISQDMPEQTESLMEEIPDEDHDFQNQMASKSSFNFKHVSYVPIADIPTEFENKKGEETPYEAKPALDEEEPIQDTASLETATSVQEEEVEPEEEEVVQPLEEPQTEITTSPEAQPGKSEDDEIDEFLLDILSDLENKNGLMEEDDIAEVQAQIEPVELDATEKADETQESFQAEAEVFVEEIPEEAQEDTEIIEEAELKTPLDESIETQIEKDEADNLFAAAIPSIKETSKEMQTDSEIIEEITRETEPGTSLDKTLETEEIDDFFPPMEQIAEEISGSEELLEESKEDEQTSETQSEIIEEISLEEILEETVIEEEQDEEIQSEVSQEEIITPVFEIDVEVTAESVEEFVEDTQPSAAQETEAEPTAEISSEQEYQPIKSEDLPEIDLDADLNRLLIELNEKAQSESAQQPPPESGNADELLEEALQNIPLAAEEESERKAGEATDSLLIKPSESIVPPKRLTEDDLNVVADAESILAEFMEPLSEDEFALMEEEQAEPVPHRQPETQSDGMDEFLKLYEETSRDETNPIRIRQDVEEEEELPPEPSAPIQRQSDEEKELHDRAEFLSFIDSLKQRDDEDEEVEIEEDSLEDERLSVFSQFEDEESSDDPAFDTKKVILEVLSKMDEEDSQEAGKVFELEAPQENKESDGSEAPFFNFEDELEEVAESAEAAEAAELAIFEEEFAAVEKIDSEDDSAQDLAQVQSIDLTEIEDKQPETKESPEEEDIFAGFEELEEEEDPTAPIELNRSDQEDDLLDSLPKTRPAAGLLNDFPVYTCILVPRLSDYSLNANYAALLKDTMSQLSEAFGWEIENLIIQPTYMRWTIKVPPDVSQGFFVRKVRQYTSDKIFNSFPELSKLNPSDNFWAKGYLVVSGNEPPAPEFLDDFIQKNRRPKGIMN